MRKNFLFLTTSRKLFSVTKEFCTAKQMTKKSPDEIMDTALIPTFSTRRMKLLSRPEGVILYGNLGVEFFCTSELLYTNLKVRIRLIGAQPSFYMINDNSNVSLKN